MSPLTGSYFTSWAFFDACVGKKRETIGTIILALSKPLGLDPQLVGALTEMQASRMGLYVHEGHRERFVVLRELVTDEVVESLVSAGYRGKRGEVWLVRVHPPPVPPAGYSVVFTTPYVILEPGLAEWKAYLRRTLPKIGVDDEVSAYENLMKYGLGRNYWNEYIFEAYVNHQHDAVFLMGLPDVEESRPHSRTGYWSREE